MLDSIDVIAFDLDDTLWPCLPTIQRAEKATYEWLRTHYPRVTENYSEQDLLELRKGIMHSRAEYKIDLSWMRRHMFEILAIEHDYPVEPMVDQGFDLFIRLRHEVEFFDDVFPVLEQLNQSYRMGSISNGNASAGLTPLDDYFEYYINAADVMARKPDQKIFLAFCAEMDVAPQRCVYVGDDPHFDVQGAREAGMQSIWVNRGQQDWPQELRPAAAEISSLHELIELLPAR